MEGAGTSPGESLPIMDNRIAEFRKARGWPQQLLADKMGINVRQVQYWEAGEHDPTLRSALELAELLGVQIEDLYPKALRK